jgi:hypothetical protein
VVVAPRDRPPKASAESAGKDATFQAADAAGRDWPAPIRDRRWTDRHGAQWRMRGGLLTARQADRLLRRPDVTVLHVYGLDSPVVTGLERDALTVRIEEFFAGCAPPMSDFAIAEFPNGQRQVMLVIQEYC